MAVDLQEMDIVDEMEHLDGGRDSDDADESGGSDKGDDKPTPEAAPAAGLAELQAEMAEMRRINSDLVTRLNRPAPVAATPEPDDEPEEADPDPAALADELSTRGLAALRDRGFLTAKQARAMVREEAGKIARSEIQQVRNSSAAEAAILAPYAAELNDPASPLRTETAKIFREMIGDDESIAHTPAGTRMLAAAVRAAKAELAATESTRQGRVARQGGDSGAPAKAAGGFVARETGMSSQDREVAKRFGVTEKQFLAQRSAIRGGR